MNLFRRRMELFCVSNVMVSFICTSFLGTTYSATLEEAGQEKKQEIVASSEVDPLSQLGDKNKTTEIDVPNLEEIVEKKKTVTSTTKKTTNVVTKKEVKSTKIYTPAKYNEVTGSAVVEYAKKYLGLRYVSAGNSLSTGTDCSGFTKLIYKEFGVSLGRTVRSQMNSGTYVRKSDLQKGDLVFYANGNGKASHVAMYIGNGQVIHESTYKYGVKISSVNMMQYITARRVINNKANEIVEKKLLEEQAKNQPAEVPTETVSTEATNTNVNESTASNTDVTTSSETETIPIKENENTASTSENNNSESTVNNNEKINNNSESITNSTESSTNNLESTTNNTESNTNNNPSTSPVANMDNNKEESKVNVESTEGEN